MSDDTTRVGPPREFWEKFTAGGARREAMETRDFIMQFFTYSHLPPHLQEVSKPFWELAEHIHSTLPRNPERTVALRKLLEAKDAAVRALLAKESS